jgi:hypothetical protein
MVAVNNEERRNGNVGCVAFSTFGWFFGYLKLRVLAVSVRFLVLTVAIY